jgi:N-acetylglucosaminyldiphosphoundecaprenol N-acetyl-beta-D-mannosaminyltransferase
MGSRFLFIGISDPKQSLISKKIDELINLGNKDIYFSTALLGASFEFYLGKSKRAPQWMQQCGLEWLYRFALEPKRLWRRYTIDNFKFLMLALKEL